ncbi:MAG TPA: biotin--[acetyl-CoA-carboxylase] ligase [Acidimicrobiia bacterium]|jgi:BirA family biotin operon repressor/biotin-[acetyl-CoA-carboxylase] ligase
MSTPARTSERGRWRVEWFSTLDSTNRHALDAARTGAPDGLVVVADEQTAGRGRLGRTWEAPPGSSLLVSVLLRRSGDPARAAGHVVMAAGVALAEAVEDVAGVDAGLKWPNDLVVDDRKLAGLLAEADGDALVVGAGCNVNWEEFPEELVATATACNLEAGHLVDRDALLDAFLDRFATALGAGDAVVDEYRARLATLGRSVRVEHVHDRDRDLVGTAVGITDDGALVVRGEQGIDHPVVAADVHHLR